jgi:hypothetical protein
MRVRRGEESEREKRGEESNVRHKGKNRQLNMNSVYLQVFVPRMQLKSAKTSFPTPTPVNPRAQTPTEPAYYFTRQPSHFRQHGSRTTNSSSRYFDTAIWSPSPFLRRVFSTRSRASACPDAGSSGRSLILVSVGSPDVHMTTT